MKYVITIIAAIFLSACMGGPVPHRDLPDTRTTAPAVVAVAFTPDPLTTCYSDRRKHLHWFLPIGADEKVQREHNHRGKSKHSHTHSSSAWCE